MADSFFTWAELWPLFLKSAVSIHGTPEANSA